MIYSETEILQYVEENDVKFVKLTFCDVYGKLKNISILSSELGTIFKNGARISAKKIDGFSAAQGKDLFLFPDSRTMKVLPWRPQHGRVIRMFCFIRYADNTPFEWDGRYFLKKAAAYAVEKGYSFRFSTSSEFTLFRMDENGIPTKTPHDYAGYCDIAPDDKGENFRRDVCLTLEQMEIHPISSRHQSGFGQHEIDFNASSALRAADAFLSFKSAVKSVAENHGVHASFMPKPLKNECGNGMHIGMNVFRGDDLFCEPEDNDILTDEVKSAAAGIMKHIKEMTIFTNPIVNSYKRLGEFSAPRYITWSDNEADQLIKINSVSNGEAPMVLRAPDCSCNPYFVFGLMIYAALEGIENGLSLPEKYASEKSDYSCLPQTLDEAAQCAENSDFLKKFFPEKILNSLISECSSQWNIYSSVADKEIYEEKKYFYSL